MRQLVYTSPMPIETTQDLLYLILAIVAAVVAGFLSWGLYELARLLRQTNDVVTETRNRVERIESGIMGLKERFESSMGYVAMLAEGGKSLFSLLRSREEKKETKTKKGKKLAEEEDEE